MSRLFGDTSRPVLIRRSEMAANLGMSEKTLARSEAAGRFPASIRVGNHPCYFADDVEHWLNRQREGAALAHAEDLGDGTDEVTAAE